MPPSRLSENGAQGSQIDSETIDVSAFAHEVWARGSTLNPPGTVTGAAARNRWRFEAGAARAAYAALDTLGDARPRRADEVVALLARAVIIGSKLFAYESPEADAALTWARDAVADAVRRVQRDFIRRAEAARTNGHVSAPARDERESFIPPSFPAEAMPGPWGELVTVWAEWTEAHPASIVLPALIQLGIHGGQGVRLGVQRCAEYLAVLGPSSIGRKDTGLGIAEEFAAAVGAAPLTRGAPGSGEGIFYLMRDPTDDDAGAIDTRVCLADCEMAATLAAAHRNGSTVLPSLLSLYDTGRRDTLTKRDRIRVSKGHFGYIGLSTPSEFARHLNNDDRQSGLIQRLLLAAVLRVRTVAPSRALAPQIDRAALQALAERVRDRIETAVTPRPFWCLSGEASAHLDAMAGDLVDAERPETSRAVAHVTRLAMLYALTTPPHDDEERGEGVVSLSHIDAALAAWRYCSASAAIILGRGDLLDRIVMLARDADEGLTRTELFRFTSNNVSAAALDEAIRQGCACGLLCLVDVRNGKPGRPQQRVVAR